METSPEYISSTPIFGNRSQEIGKLAFALSQAQADITGAKKDSENPFFKKNYADLASCWDACREPLSKNKLAVIQTTDDSEKGVTVITTLAHESGQYITGRLTLTPKKNDPQGMGSAITYARRYALSAIVGLAQIDDDANDATRPKDKKPPKNNKKQQKVKVISQVQLAEINKLITETGTDLKKFLKYALVDDIADIPEDSFITVRDALKKKPKITTVKKVEPILREGFIMCSIPGNGQVPITYCNDDCPEKGSCKEYKEAK